jgi:hypothetical protein
MGINAILPGQVLANGASDGDLLTVQADGSVAFEAPAGGGIGGSVDTVDSVLVASSGTTGDTVKSAGIAVNQSPTLGSIIILGTNTDPAPASMYVNCKNYYTAQGRIYTNGSGASLMCAPWDPDYSFAFVSQGGIQFALERYQGISARGFNLMSGSASNSSSVYNSKTLLWSLSAKLPNEAILVNGTNAQSFQVGRTYTSATSYEMAGISWSGDVAVLSTSAGTAGGTKRGLQICSATTDELGFFGATPVDQPATVADPSGGGTVDTEARAAIAAVIDRLQELGLIA